MGEGAMRKNCGICTLFESLKKRKRILDQVSFF